MQLTNANLPGWMLMAEGLGMSIQELREATRKGLIDAETGIAGLLNGLRKYDGMMDQISTRTVSGLWSNIKDTFNIKVIERWGQGLKDGALDAFIKLADVLEVIDPHLLSLGDYLYKTGNYLSGKFAVAVDKSLGRLVKLLDSEEFKNANVFGKIGLAWDKIIAEPFSKWWDDTGKALVVRKAGEIGEGLGSGISSGVAALLGFDAVGATADGLDIGKAFTDGFIDGLDTEKIREAFISTFKDIAKDALKVLPGGDSPTTSSWISAGILGFLGRKPLGKMLGKMGGSLFKGFGADDLRYIEWLRKNANPKGKGNFLGGLSGGFSSLMGKIGGSKAGGFFKNNWLSLLFAGGAIASADDKWAEAGRQSAGLAGSLGLGALGTKAGAAIGSFIMPGVGTAVGAGIGGFAGSTLGYLAGDKGAGRVMEWWRGDYDQDEGIFAGGGKELVIDIWEDVKKDFKDLTGSLGESWDSAVEMFKGIPETISTSFSSSWDIVCEGFNRAWAGIEEDFEELSVWWSETMNGISLFFNETLPTWWGEVKDNAGLFFTETLPGWWNNTVDSITTFWTETVPSYWNGAADTIASGWGEVKQYFKTKADELVGWFNEKKEEVKTAWEGSTIKKGIDKGVGWVQEKLGIEGEHATGGFFSRPHVGLVAEDGPEAIIPLGAKRRQRGLDLWKQAGLALGVTPYANGGIVGRESAPSGGINVGGVTVNITVDGSHATLVDALNSQSEEIKEAIAGILYEALSESFQNQPILI